jgi:hypothetical protein
LALIVNERVVPTKLPFAVFALAAVIQMSSLTRASPYEATD